MRTILTGTHTHTETETDKLIAIGEILQICLISKSTYCASHDRQLPVWQLCEKKQKSPLIIE